MTPERHLQIKSIFDSALQCEPRYRSAFLVAACAGDETLRAEVESLIASYEAAGSFIDAPAYEQAAEMIERRQAGSIIGLMLGRYQLGALLGAGGMGEVYRARDTRLEREVAVKILPEQLALDSETLARFEREAKAVAALSHPNILSIFDIGGEQGINYAVMELLEGETLRARLNRSALPLQESLRIAVALTSGLQAAHSKGIIHRDLKPENIFLTSDGGVKILDFGIARVHAVSPEDMALAVTATEMTRPGTMMGTLGYMSPEQVRGEVAEAPSDIFSFGCVLYEMVTGERPFVRATTAETIAAILKDEPSRLNGKSIPAGLVRVLQRCLKKIPTERYQSATDVATELASHLERGEGQGYKLPTRRWRSVIWGATASIGALLVAAAWFAFVQWQARGIYSLAVLPLVNESRNQDLDYLSDGLTESLINRLSQLSQLQVIARSTVSTYKGREIDPRRVGQELKVRGVLTGRMLQRGDTLTIHTELVDAANGSQLWGNRYNWTASDILIGQEEIAKQISEKLNLRLTGDEQHRLTNHYTENPDAYRLYLKGLYHSNQFTAEGLRQGISFLNEAIELDPIYPLAYAGLAAAYYNSSGLYLPPAEAMPRSKAAALKALQLDEALAEAHTSLGQAEELYEWNRVGAEREYKRALSLNPSYALAHQYYGLHLLQQGEMDGAIKEMTVARELDPLTPYISTYLSFFYYIARRYDEAIAQLRTFIQANPNFAIGHYTLALAYEQKAMFEEAITEMNQARLLDPENPYPLALLGHAYAASGQRAKAYEMLGLLQERARKRYIDSYNIAGVYAGLGEKEEVFRHLERAYEMRSEELLNLKVDPKFDALHSDPRFTDLLRRLHLAS